MKAVAIVDTSIFCEILNIPGKNNKHDQVIQEFMTLIQGETNFLLPMATVYETGNHIAKLSEGSYRRQFAEVFIEQVEKAIKGEAPWQVMHLPNMTEVNEWLSDFPDEAMRNVSMGDLSIKKEWEKMRIKTPNYRVFVWSLDRHLQGYIYNPQS